MSLLKRTLEEARLTTASLLQSALSEGRSYRATNRIGDVDQPLPSDTPRAFYLENPEDSGVTIEFIDGEFKGAGYTTLDVYKNVTLETDKAELDDALASNRLIGDAPGEPEHAVAKAGLESTDWTGGTLHSEPALMGGEEGSLTDGDVVMGQSAELDEIEVEPGENVLAELTNRTGGSYTYQLTGIIVEADQ